VTVTTAIDIAGLDGGTVRVPAAPVADLAARVRGALLTDGDDGWDTAVSVWNATTASRPALVVQPLSAADVVTAVAFARDHGLRLSVKGGGHHLAGIAVAEGGLLLDMSRMRDVEVDPAAQLAHVGPGCLLGDVDAATQAHGLATVLGFISQVGVAGLTLGGGLGYLTRRFGWTVDNLQQVEVVTADGAVRVTDRQHEPQLFWALRGAGANFGVVTRFTYRLHEVGPTVYGGLIAWPYERADEVAAVYRSLTATAPRELAAWLVLLRAPEAPFVPPAWRGRRVAGMTLCYSGDLADTAGVTAPLRALGDPVVDLLAEQPYTSVQSYLDDGEPRGQAYYWKTEHLAELPEELLSLLVDLYAECPIPDGDIGILHLGGALNEHADDDGAVGNRDARYAVGFKGMWAPGGPDADRYQDWIRGAWERVQRFSTGATYINFQAADEDDERIRAAYGSNLPRLLHLKAAYDPDNLFRSNRNLRPVAGAGR